MALLKPVTNSKITQYFGGNFSAEPKRYHQEYRGLPLACYPTLFPGADAVPTLHYHEGIDYAAPTGTPILAAERCKIEQYGTDPVSKALYVYARIRPQTRIENWHLSRFRAGLYKGQIIPKGGIIGYVGMTGWATGPHDHFALRISEKDPDGVTRFYNYNPALFMVGGILANDARIKPYY